MLFKLSFMQILPAIRKSLPVSLVVGTFLTLINQVDLLYFSFPLSNIEYTDVIRFLLNYLTPLSVAS